MKIKIQLNKNELTALHIVLVDVVQRCRQLVKHQEFANKLENQAISEIMTTLFVKITLKLDNASSQKNTLSLNMHQAWALSRTLNHVVDFLDEYSMAVVLRILGTINQKTA